MVIPLSRQDDAPRTPASSQSQIPGSATASMWEAASPARSSATASSCMRSYPRRACVRAMSAAHTLLFDLDGTLTDNTPRHRRVHPPRAACGWAPARPDDAALRECVGPPLRGSFARLLATEDAAVVDRAIGHYRERFDDVGWRENVVYPGIADALAALAARGHRMFLCTSKPRRLRAAHRRALRLRRRTSQRVYGADLDGALDDKATLLAHLIARENARPARTVMIGDRHHDVRAARANGDARGRRAVGLRLARRAGGRRRAGGDAGGPRVRRWRRASSA